MLSAYAYRPSASINKGKTKVKIPLNYKTIQCVETYKELVELLERTYFNIKLLAT